MGEDTTHVSKLDEVRTTTVTFESSSGVTCPLRLDQVLDVEVVELDHWKVGKA